MTTAPSYRKPKNPDMDLQGHVGLDITMASDGSTGHRDQHGPWWQQRVLFLKSLFSLESVWEVSVPHRNYADQQPAVIKKIAFFSLHPPDTVIIYYNNMKKIDMNHKALLFNLCLFSGTKETFQVTGFLWWNKAQGSLKCVALGTQVSMPGEPLFSRWQLVSKVLLWVCDLWNSVSLCPSSFLLAMTLSSDGCSQEAGNCYKVCIQTVITNA